MTGREELTNDIMNILVRFDVPTQEVRSAIFLAIDKYEVEQRTTEIAVYEGDDIAKYCNKFLQAKMVAGCTERTINMYKSSLRRAFTEIQKSPLQLTADDIRRFLAIKEVRDKVSKGQLKNELRVLSSFCSWLNDNGYIARNPTKQVEKIRHKPHKEKAFTDIEAELLRDGCRDNRERAIVETLLSTGCRVSELVSIKISDINDNERGIEIFGKGEKYRMVYLNAKALMAIKRYLEERTDCNPWLFPRSVSIKEFAGKQKEMHEWYKLSDHVHPTMNTDKGTIESIVRKLGQRAGVIKVHPHRFRKTCATNALRSGMPLELVSKMLGHESIETTQIYLDIKEEDLQIAHKKYVR